VRCLELSASIGQGSFDCAFPRLRTRMLRSSKSEIVFVPYEQAYAPGFEDMMRRVPAVDKLQGLVGFRPTIQVGVVIERLIEHMRGEKVPASPALAS
jgi:UDP-glucose 4-epimerase